MIRVLQIQNKISSLTKYSSKCVRLQIINSRIWMKIQTLISIHILSRPRRCSFLRISFKIMSILIITTYRTLRLVEVKTTLKLQ